MKTITVCTLYKPIFVVEINTFICNNFTCTVWYFLVKININLQSESQTPWLNASLS